MAPFKPIDEYEPRQRGIVAVATRVPRSGRRLLRDGDQTVEECSDCGGLLRVRRGRTGPALLWCPCGYETDAP